MPIRKMSGNLSYAPRIYIYIYIYIYTYTQTIFGPGIADVYAHRNMRVRNQKRHERVKLCMLEGS